MKNLIVVLIACTAILASCSNPQETPLVEPLALPTQNSSSLPRLFTNAKGETFLSWVERNPEKVAKLYFSKLKDGQWQSPRLIAEGSNWFINWADFPSVIENNELMAAHWLQKSEKGTYDYDIQVAFSNNSGNNWQAPITPHKDGISAEHGFVTMLPLEDQKTFVTWLDGRNTKGDHAKDGGHGGAGAMTLRAAVFDSEGETLEEWELDDRVCDCCQTAAAQTKDGLVVVYRDRSEGEIRDMSVVRYVNGEWTKPQPLKVEMWEMPACPVNGPSITAQGNQLAVAWFMAKGGYPEVKLAFSQDGGATFGEAVVVSHGTTNGRVGTTTLNNGNVLVSWLETADDTAKIMLAKYDKTGTLLKRMTIAETSAARASGFPVLTSNGEDIYMAWTQADEQTSIKTAKVNFE
ncbi:exo-alpha-sialidase [Roseivirga sp. UBA838]|uniref:exo-alpha-sialidase n=1 Tax=Roseivirga sp. UBA838 TaxID=1947393 RepID=UPI00257CF99A|nr:exo-alpha-sialidase [Roseivirga sp. UBA838]|tara:strand:- start:15745 stop:16962 length:1218 start_codon:yes stop_codon:yes gene_type:complete